MAEGREGKKKKRKQEKLPVRLSKALPDDWSVETVKAEIQKWADDQVDTTHRIVLSFSANDYRYIVVRFKCRSCRTCAWRGSARVDVTDDPAWLVITATDEDRHNGFDNRRTAQSLTAEERKVVKELVLRDCQTRLQDVMQAPEPFVSGRARLVQSRKPRLLHAPDIPSGCRSYRNDCRRRKRWNHK
jgi:hypothetical protein